MHINKISAKMQDGCDVDQACRELSPYYDVIRHENNAFVGTTVELVPKGCNKAVGIAAVCRSFGIEWEDTVVFGDSNNDLSMFEYASTKVAMGGRLCYNRYVPLWNSKRAYKTWTYLSSVNTVYSRVI